MNKIITYQDPRGIALSNGAIFKFFFVTFFFMMLIFPSQYQLERGVYLVFIFFSSLVAWTIRVKKWRVNRRIILPSGLCLLVSLAGSLNGVINFNPGAIPMLTVYLYWPILFIWFLGFMHDENIFYTSIKVIISSALLISVLIVLYVFGLVLGVAEVFFPLLNIFEINYGYVEGSIKVSTTMLPVLFFFLPFSICLLFIKNSISKDKLSRRWKKLNLIALWGTLFVLLISGRAGFWAVALVSIPISLLLIFLCVGTVKVGKKVLYSIVGFVVVASLGLVISQYVENVNLNTYYNLFIEKLFQASDPGSIGYRRYSQMVALFQAIKEHPLIGHGFGAVIPNFEGNIVWQVELSYLLLLFQVGTLGFLVYLLSIIWMFRRLIKISARHIEISVIAAPFLAGMLGFLIANSTNPLLSKFDYLWVIFLPLALLNFSVCRLRKLKKSSSLNLKKKQNED